MQLSIPGLPPGGGGGAMTNGPVGPGGINFIPSPFMSQLGLPPAIMALFAPRQPLDFKPQPPKRKLPYMSGIAAYTSLFETEKPSDMKAWRPPENKRKKKERILAERKERNEAKMKEHQKTWDPNANSSATAEPLNTLFVARINYETTEQKLRREFETYGAVRTIKMITDLQGLFVWLFPCWQVLLSTVRETQCQAPVQQLFHVVEPQLSTSSQRQLSCVRLLGQFRFQCWPAIGRVVYFGIQMSVPQSW